MAQLSCRALTLGYEGRTVAENLNFQVNHGDYLVIVGENGSGKSTLLKAILHLHAPLAGELSFGDGLDRASIGYLPQRSEVQSDFPASCYEVVLSGALSGCGLRPFYRRKEKKAALDAMKRLDVYDLRDRSFAELSGGQQQRVLLCRALCSANRMLVLDEPSSGLDAVSINELYRTVARLREEGVTVLMVSHDLSAVFSDVTHVLHIGEPTFFGTKEEYRARFFESEQKEEKDLGLA